MPATGESGSSAGPALDANGAVAGEPLRTTDRRAGVLNKPAAVDLAPSPNRLGTPTPRVAAIIVTWNRRDMVDHVLGAVSRQGFPLDALDVVVVDNGSTDGTVEYLAERWGPERVVANATDRADEPAFVVRSPGRHGRNAAGFRSLTVIGNAHNLGGCGGFNTGFAFVDAELRPDYAWLLDDDIDLPPDALSRLAGTAEANPEAGLVGSRTKHIDDRRLTIESTIYFNQSTGCMADHPTRGHPLYESHQRWAEQTGGPKGEIDLAGLREVDVVSACSMLARWSAVEQVGFWDRRFFIYCDDADWCLRFARAGWRVVLDLDAIVYHTPWHHKLTPERHYYAQRNAAWMLHKAAPARRLRRAMLARLFRILGEAWITAWRRSLFNAELIRRSALDVVRGRGGRLDPPGPAPVPLPDAFARAGVLRPGARVAILCRAPHFVPWAGELRATLRDAGHEIEWTEFVRNDVSEAARADDGTARVVYGGRLRSKLRRQLGTLLRPPHAVVVFDTFNDLPLFRGRWNIHINGKDRSMARVERDGLLAKARFAARWLAAAAHCLIWSLRVRPFRAEGRHG